MFQETENLQSLRGCQTSSRNTMLTAHPWPKVNSNYIQPLSTTYYLGKKVWTASRDPSRCTHSSHRCHHAAHAYTGVPCSHKGQRSKPRRQRSRGRRQGGQLGGSLPRIEPGLGVRNKDQPGLSLRTKDQPVTLQLKQGGNVQALKLPTDKLEPNKKYYVTFTLKPKENGKHQFENIQRQSSVY